MIRAGLQIPNFTYPGVAPEQLFDRVADVAVAAEESGFDTAMVMDHFYQPPLLGPPEHEMFEAYTLLGAIAARTSTAKLGTLVTGVTYRNPAILAKIVTSLDVISKGRAFLGIGAAWYEREHEYFGIPFPPLGERFDRLEEQLAILSGIWDTKPGERFSYEGKHYQVDSARLVPKPVQQPTPPIWIGATSASGIRRAGLRGANLLGLANPAMQAVYEQARQEALQAADALRQAEDARKGRGVLARLRAAWRGE